MRRIICTLRHDDDQSLIAELAWSDGRVEILAATARIRPNLERVIERGLMESVGTGGDKQLRTTSSTDPKFLERLAAYFSRQFAFMVEVREEEGKRREEERRWPSSFRAKATVS